MLRRRYPHALAGRTAAGAFLLAGFVGGWLAGDRIAGGPGPIPGAITWAIVAALVAYLVFSSEGPARRPDAGWQAGMADGLVSGVIAAAIGATIDLIVASGAGSSGGGSLSGGTIVGALGASAGIGAAAGAVIGLALGFMPLMRRPAATGRRRRERKPGSPVARPVSPRLGVPQEATRKPSGTKETAVSSRPPSKRKARRR